MKIGVITYWQSCDNYGQQLQCWALQQYLIKLGHEPYLIRYDFKNRVPIHNFIDRFKTWLIYKKIKNLILSFLRIIKKPTELKNIKRQFHNFRKHNLKCSARIYISLEDLQRHPPLADAYIVGSDQVWSQTLLNIENEVFFLNFGATNIKRISYAPSFALKTYPDAVKQRLYELLSAFSCVSVRDDSSLDICSQVGINAIKVVDPTLLLTPKEYDSIERITAHSYPFVYIYILNVRSPEEIRFAELQTYMYTRCLSCKATASSGYFPANEVLATDYIYPNVGEWINTIRQAEYVVTPSFHGVVFCILMHTPFVYIPLQGQYSSGNDRVLSLLSDLNLIDRVLTDDVSYETIMNKQIDWVLIDKSVDELRSSSYSFIREALGC